MGFFSDAGEWLANTGKAVADGVHQFGKDVIGVGKQVAGMTFDAGAAILDGGYTAITNPAKFIKDVGNNVASYAEHVSDSWTKGAETIGKGWSEMKDGRSLWNALGCTVNGLGQMSSMGLSDMWDDHVEATMETHRDELGNVTGYTAKEGTDYITQRWIEGGAERRALVQNSEEEIAEAIADGDKERVSELDDKLFQATTGKDLAKIATTTAVIAGVVAAVPTGGASLAGTAGVLVAHAGTIAAASAATGVVAGGVGENRAIDLDEMNLQDDISDAISSQVEALKASGRLAEDQVEAYTDVMTTYYKSTLYGSADPNLAANSGFSSNEEMRDWLLANNGLPTLGEAGNMERGELDSAYGSYYDDMAGYGVMDRQIAAAMATFGSAYAAGEITQEEYAKCACRVQCEMFDITDEQKDAYAAYSADLALGNITPDEFAGAVASDPSFAGYITENGFELPLAEGVSSDLPELIAEQAASYEVSEEDMQRRETLSRASAAYDGPTDTMEIGSMPG